MLSFQCAALWLPIFFFNSPLDLSTTTRGITSLMNANLQRLLKKILLLLFFIFMSGPDNLCHHIFSCNVLHIAFQVFRQTALSWEFSSILETSCNTFQREENIWFSLCSLSSSPNITIFHFSACIKDNTNKLY